jgi:hypothetical protein
MTFAGGTLVLLLATPASATVTGGCQGSGTINGTHYDDAALDPAQPITIPDETDVNYDGSVPLPPGTNNRAYSGKVDLQLPLGGSVTVADWGGSSKKVGAAGGSHGSGGGRDHRLGGSAGQGRLPPGR